MKTDIFDMSGKKKGSFDLPSCFTYEIRQDIVSKVLEIKKRKQPHSPSPVAGKQHSASGILIHKRKVWKSQYGRGMSRIPRKVMSRRGSQFNWIGAEIPSAVGGKRAHPPKVLSMVNSGKINKKEMKMAMCSSLSATANPELVSKRYDRLKDEKIQNLPFVIESKIVSSKTKSLSDSLKKILGEKLYSVGLRKKSIRSGRGKLRGRKYKKTAGLLFVIGEKEKFKSKMFDIVRSNELGVSDLAKGGLGRLTMYTEQAIKELGEKLK